MNKKIKKYLTLNIKAQIEGFNVGGGVVMAGKPGIGKTATIKELAKNENLHFVHISLPELTPEELSGIPEFEPAPHLENYNINSTNKTLATVWSASQLIFRCNTLAQDEKKNGVLLAIDDLHRINMATAPYLYALLGERKLGEFILDKKVAIVGAMNDSEEAGFDGIDSPIKDRIGILKVKFEFEDWYELIGAKLNPYVSTFLKSRPDLVIEPESSDIEQFATPRSWTYLSQEIDYIFEQNEEEFFYENNFMIASQKVSTESAVEFSKHIAYIKSLDIKSIVFERKMFNAKTLKVLDQIVYAFLVNYIDTIEDAKYLVKLLKKNVAVENFTGSLIIEAYNRYEKFLSNSNLGKIKGLEVFINNILGDNSVNIGIDDLTKTKIYSIIEKYFNTK